MTQLEAKEKRSRTEDCQKVFDKVNSEQKKLVSPKQKASLNSGKWCEYHQTLGHDTNKCNVVFAQAHRMFAAWETKSESQTREERQNKKDQKLNTLGANQVKQILKSATLSKKAGDKAEDLNIMGNLRDFELLYLDESLGEE